MLLTDEEIQKRLEELSGISLTLDADPVMSGLSAINAKIAQVQGQKDYINHLLVESIKNKAEAEILLETKRNEYNRKLDEFMATDPEVQAQKNKEARVSLANTKMSDLVLAVFYAEKDYTRAEAYFKCIQQTYNNLESMNSNLSRQISVIQMGINIGELDPTAFRELFTGRQINIKTQGDK